MTKVGARERLLDAADELFYAEGVQTVGIDRVIEHAGVAKASLYNTFGSKDELVRAYLEARHARTATRISRHVERYTDPTDRLLAVFEAQDEMVHEPTYRGCAFAAASTEARPDGAVVHAAETYRRWVRELLTDLAAQVDGVADPVTLGRRLHFLYDGVGVSARMDHDREAAQAARAAALVLVEAATRR
jgi:AcrR family transcriptional regulator